MDNNNLNCLIIHKGYQPYLKYNLKITSKFNNVFLIGDSSVEFLESISDKITFINIEKYSNNNKVNDLIRNKTIKLANIHFQGKAKVYLNRFTRLRLFFGLA